MSFLYFAVNDGKLAHDTGGVGRSRHRTETENRWHTIGVVVAVFAALISAYALILLWGSPCFWRG